MATVIREPAVALYWDFENIHASVYDVLHGEGSFSRVRFRPHESLVEIAAIATYARSLGTIAINRAYANWQGFARYRDDLNFYGIDLIQQFPRGMKNGTDIRLALDVLEDLYRYPHISHVVVVSSDSDYISLAQKIRQLGRQIIGIGVEENANPYWVQSCSQFIFYRTLISTPLREAGMLETIELPDLPDLGALERARQLLLRAIRSLIAQRGEPIVPRSAVKMLMVRSDPAFDETRLGFPSFSAFVDHFRHDVRNIHNDSGGFVRLINGAEVDGEVIDPSYGQESTPELAYASTLKRGNVRLMPYAWWRPALAQVEAIFRAAPNQIIPSFDELKRQLAERLRQIGLSDDQSMINKLRLNLFSLHQFELLGDQVGLRLRALDPANSLPSLQYAVEYELLHRLIGYHNAPLAIAAVTQLLRNSDDPLDQAEIAALIGELDQATFAIPSSLHH